MALFCTKPKRVVDNYIYDVNHLCTLEALFGMAPFASHTMEELEDKVLDQKPVEVGLRMILMYVYICNNFV